MSKVGIFFCCVFLIGLVVIIGGVVFGVYIVKLFFFNFIVQNLFEGVVIFNFWVLIDVEKIIVIVLYGDKGQGIFLVQVVLIVEEFDVELDQIDISFGMLNKVYFNIVMVGVMVGYLLYDFSLIVEWICGIVGGVMKVVLFLMGIGGLIVILDSYDKLCFVGVCVCEMFKLVVLQ